MNPLSMPYLEEDESQMPSQIIAQCRICLQPISCLNDLTYCNCKGTLKNVHEGCFLEWIKMNKIIKEYNNYYGCCQLCKEKIMLSTQKIIKLKPFDKFCSETFCHFSRLACIQSIFTFLLLAVIFATQVTLIVLFIINDTLKQSKLTIALISINGTFLVIGAIYLVFNYVLQIKVQITGIKNVRIENKLTTTNNRTDDQFD